MSAATSASDCPSTHPPCMAFVDKKKMLLVPLSESRIPHILQWNQTQVPALRRR